MPHRIVGRDIEARPVQRYGVGMAAQGPSNRDLNVGTRQVLEELRDLRVEMRADRRTADTERRQADEQLRQERRESGERFRLAMREYRQGFQETVREFREDSLRRDAAFHKAFKGVRTVGLSIVKTLNHHTRILERIERKLDVRNGRRGRDNGGARS